MPGSTSLPECARRIRPLPTKENLEFAELPTIDLSEAQTPEGRAALYPQVRDALRNYGFMYAINHGYTQAQTDRIFDIADVPFTGVPSEEKDNFTADVFNAGHYQGYKHRRFWKVDTDTGATDRVELYSISMDINRRAHPRGLQPFLPEIDTFARQNHFNVLHPILRIIALSLELPEETLVEQHKFAGLGQSAVSFMKYYIRTQEEEEAAKNVWLKGHTDMGSISVLWSQPTAGLQILSPNGKWQWLKHVDNALVINTGDTLDFLSGGFYKPTIHRVIQPPADQREHPRLCVFYFAMPDDATPLIPFSESPVLQREGFERRCEDHLAPTMEVWRKERTKSYGRTDLTKSEQEEGVEEEVIKGIVVKHYN